MTGQFLIWALLILELVKNHQFPDYLSLVADLLLFSLQVWHIADVPQKDKFQYTYFAHKINSFDTAPTKLLESDSRLRPDRYALERGDLSKAGAEKSRSLSLSPPKKHKSICCCFKFPGGNKISNKYVLIDSYFNSFLLLISAFFFNDEFSAFSL